MLNLLQIQSLLLVKLTLLGFLESLGLFLSLKCGIHPIIGLSCVPLSFFARLMSPLLCSELDTLSLFDSLSEALTSSLLSSRELSLGLLCCTKLGLVLLTLFPPFVFRLS